MTIKRGNKGLFPYLGDYSPVNIYKGETKLAGWKWQSESGKVLQFQNDYKDVVHVEVDGLSIGGGSGKNLLNFKAFINSMDGASRGTITSQDEKSFTIRADGDDAYTQSYDTKGVITPVTQSKIYTLSFDKTNSVETSVLIFYYNSSSLVTRFNYVTFNTSEKGRNSITVTTPVGTIGVKLRFGVKKSGDTETFSNIQLEEGTVATQYEPPAPTPDYPIAINSLNNVDIVSSSLPKGNIDIQTIPYDTQSPTLYKTNLSLSEPLRSVGDVKDRLFLDSDGLWKVERNVGEYAITGNEGLSITSRTSTVLFNSTTDIGAKRTGSDSLNLLSTHFKPNIMFAKDEEGVYFNPGGLFRVSINKSRLTANTVDALKTWLTVNDAKIQYQLATPTIETLSAEQQTKLNNIQSFKGVNYVYTMVSSGVLPELHGKMKVKEI